MTSRNWPANHHTRREQTRNSVTRRAIAASTPSLLPRHLASVLPVTVAVLVVRQALTPHGLDKPITTTAGAMRELPIAAAHADRLYLSNLLVVFGLVALAFSFWVIAWLVRAAGTGIAIAAGTSGGIGAFGGTLGNLTIGFNLAAPATAHTSAEGAAHVLASGGSSVAATSCSSATWAAPDSQRSPPALRCGEAGTHRWLASLFALGLRCAAAAPRTPRHAAVASPGSRDAHVGKASPWWARTRARAGMNDDAHLVTITMPI
jgi:hypothetical protein